MAQTRPDNDGMDARATLALLRRHRLMIVAIVLAGTAIGVLYSWRQSPVYRAESRVMVRTESNQQLFPLGDTAGEYLLRQIEAEIDYLASDTYLRAASRAAASGTLDVRITAIEDDRGLPTSVISFLSSAPSPTEAQLWANGWAQTYIDERHALDVAEVEASIDSLERTGGDLRAQRATITATLTPLDDAIARTEDPDTLSRLFTERLAVQQSLTPELTPVDTQLTLLETQLAQLVIERSFLDRPTVSARVLRTAGVPADPVSPVWSRNIAIGVLAGLLLAAGFVYSREQLGDRITSVEDAVDASEAPELAALPLFDKRDFDVGTGLVATTRRSAVNATQRLVTSVEYVLGESGARALLVTSAVAGEGKSTVASNLAGLLGGSGLKVVLVDADLRRPTLHERVGEIDPPGITAVLSGACELDAALVDRPDSPAVVLPAGAQVDDAASTLRSPAFFDLMTELHQRFDRIIVDAPPVLPVTDAAELVRCVDGVVMVCRSGYTRSHQLRQATRQLRQSGAEVIGVVVNAHAADVAPYDEYITDRRG